MDVLAAGTLARMTVVLSAAAAVLQFDDVLHAPFAPGALADDHGPLMILKASQNVSAAARRCNG